LADGGTLLLDEIADLSPAAQAKLLRVLETRTIRRVGGAKEKEVNVRVIAATNVPMEELIEAKKLRKDLYYRLNVFAIHLPALRERREDIIPLAEHFLSSFTLRSGVKVGGFSRKAETALLDYEYPGNARELRNIIERAAILCKSGRIKPEHLNLPKSSKKATADNAPTPKDSEREVILKALDETKWNRKKAAEILGMPYTTLRYKIDKLGIK